MMKKKYFESVFKVGNQEVYDFINIANLRAKQYFFINDRKTSYTDQDDIIKKQWRVTLTSYHNTMI